MTSAAKTCPVLTAKLVRFKREDGSVGSHWVYGYVCGKPVATRIVTVCRDHLERKHFTWSD